VEGGRGRRRTGGCGEEEEEVEGEEGARKEQGIAFA